MMSKGTETSRSMCSFASSIDRCLGEFIEQGVSLTVQHTIALLDGSMSDGLREMTLVGSGRA
jgi:hypothetical protein